VFFWKKRAKEKQIREAENRLVIRIISELCKELPKEYNYLSLQFNEGIIAGIRKDFVNKENQGWGIVYNPAIIDKYEVELADKMYYHLFDMEDGDFIGIDKKKKVYEITHDPYEATLVDNNLLTFLKSWEDNNLNK